MAINYVTAEGFRKMQEELEHLVKTERPAISKQIGEAIEKGDISENAEYDAAKDAQGMLEAKIAQLQDLIRNSRVVDKSRIDTQSVQLLNKVKIKNLANNATMEYTLVSENEADLSQGKLATNTPIAKGLIGKKKGDKVEVEVPQGKVTFEILEIGV